MSTGAQTYQRRREETTVAKSFWNHIVYSVPPANFALIERCIDELFPWHKYVRRDDIVGYLLCREDGMDKVFFRPTEAAGQFADQIARLRQIDPALDKAVRGLKELRPDLNDHDGFRVSSIAEFERLVEKTRRIEKERPEYRLQLMDVRRPGQSNSQSDEIYEAFIRIELLGPVRNTLEMQAIKGT